MPVTASKLAPAKNDRAAGSRSFWILAGLVCLTFILAYLRSFVFPHTPILQWGDQLGFATKGSWLLAGKLPYRDFFEFVAPGTELMYASLFRVFGVSVWIPNLAMACLAAATVLLMTLCAGRIVRGAFVVLPGLLFVGFALHDSLDATHHWFSTVAAMAAIFTLLDETSSWRIAAVGALCGVAASFTQTTGFAVTVGFVVYLIWQSLQPESAGQPESARPQNAELQSVGPRKCQRDCLLLCGTALAVFIVINGPLIVAAGLHRWIDSVIVFPVRYFGTVPINRWDGSWIEFKSRAGLLKWLVYPFLYASVPLVYAVFFWSMHRRKNDRSQAWDKLLLIAMIGAAMFATIAPAISIKRISAVSPPAMVLLTWLLSRRGKMLSATAGALGVLSLTIALAMSARTQLHRYRFIDLPVGRAAIANPGIYEVYAWMMGHTRPEQWYFGMPPMYLPLGLRDPAPIEAPSPGEYGRPEQIAAAIAGLEAKRVPLMVLRPAMYVPHFLGYKRDHLQPFQDYLYEHYRRTRIFPTGDEIWERRSTPGSNMRSRSQ